MANWKTTLFGLITAAGLFMQSQSGILVKIGEILSIAGAAGTGLVAKDKNVTGGTKQNDK